ncbi:hypothetical protein ACFYY5_29720 [Nocardia elegans]|uniref:Uncharacterized protein n=1 Tax=Nocardia elegans TaxID=300029 RepID=A0ABW6TLL4_9NOCA
MKLSTPTTRWRRIDSTTGYDGWTVRWYLDASPAVKVLGATTPEGREAVLPDGETPLSVARKYLPAAVCDQIEDEKYKDCPSMQAFLRNCRQARESWHEYWSARGMA